MIVLDCSAAVDMVRETEAGRALRQLMLEGEEVISSQLFLIEVSNAFWKYHKAGLLDEKTVCANIEKAIALVDEFCDLDKTQCCEATKEAMRLRPSRLRHAVLRARAAQCGHVVHAGSQAATVVIGQRGELRADGHRVLAGRSRAFCMKPDAYFDPHSLDAVQ